MRKWRHVIGIQTEKDTEKLTALCHPNPHAATIWRGCLEGRFERPAREVEWDYFNLVGREIEDSQLVKETTDPNDIEVFCYFKETASVSLFSPKFLVTLSKTLASCKAVLCLDLNPHRSSRICPRLLLRLESWQIWYFQIICLSCPIDVWDD